MTANGIHINITDRKFVEKKLQKTEFLKEQLIDISFDCIVLMDEKGNQNYVSGSVTKILGYLPEELTGIPVIKDMLHPDDQLAVQQAFERVLGGEIASVQYRHRHKNGEWVWLEARAKNLLADQSIRSVVVVTREITERKKSEQALRESEERYRLIAENTSDSIWTMDPELRFTYVSPSTKKLFGYTVEEWIRQGWQMLVLPKYMKTIRKTFETIRRGEKDTETAIIEVFSKDQREMWIEFSASPILTADGQLRGFVGVTRDITERKRTEEALANTQKLESLGILAGGIAHDFNNLLCNIYGNLGLASEVTENPEVSEYITEVLDTLNRARGLSRQLLTFAKGGEPVKKVESLKSFITETTKFALSGSNVAYNLNIDENLWQCKIDRHQIEQVIDNILINAQQAMPEGGRIEITAQNAPAKKRPGNCVKIEIKDHGIGMPQKILSKIFDPFFTTKVKGHGLGLATCYSIIKRHSGWIQVHSEPGQGSTFTIFLPAFTKILLDKQEKINSRHQGNGLFLVMDDEEKTRKTIGKILKSLGYTVVLVENGQEAIHFFSKNQQKITALIFDLTVPGAMGGKETIGKIRKISTHIPVFVISGYADDPVMANPKKYGFTASIAKPFSKKEFEECLNTFMTKNSSKLSVP